MKRFKMKEILLDPSKRAQGTIAPIINVKTIYVQRLILPTSKTLPLKIIKYGLITVLKFFRETETISFILREREILFDFKELARIVMEVGKAKVCRTGQQVGDPEKS